MNGSTWLKRYFTQTELVSLSPKVVFDGTRYAVLRISRNGSSAFIGVWKGGRNNLTGHEPLHQGGADGDALAKMKAWLVKKDVR